MLPVMRIAAGDLSAEIVPSLGAGLASFDIGKQPLFRRWSGSADPFSLACILLLPWSNRVSRGGFSHEGQFYKLQPNLEEPLPVHGNGFQAAWQIRNDGPDFVELEMHSDGPGPYRYRARVKYGLTPSRLVMELFFRNLADLALPVGLGFHPWLVRTPQTGLQAGVDEVWLEDARHLPDRRVPISERPDWDFGCGRPLPEEWINNAFSWDRSARVTWQELGLAMQINASEQLNWAIVYSPSQKADFFCFEPVSHPVDAYWLPGGAEANGMSVLQPNDDLSVWAEFCVLRA